MSSNQRLAINGGSKAVTLPLPPMYPGGMRLGAEEEEAVLSVLRSKRLFRYYGPYPGESQTAQLEQAFAHHIGTAYGAAVSSGMGALMCALAALGVGPGDEVIVPAYTWIATASAVVMMGAVPIIAEVDESLNLDPADVERKVTAFTKAIAPVHMRGVPARMDELLDVAHRHNLTVLEDAAQAAGASYRGRRVGSIGDIGAFSLQFNKIITSGEGGIVTTSDRALLERVLMYNDVVGGLRNGVPTDQILPGMTLRMTELQAAVALVQLGRLEQLLADMRRNKGMIKAAVTPGAREHGITFRTLNDAEGEAAIALVFFTPTGEQADFAAQALSAEGVGAAVIYHPEKVDYHVYPHWAPIMHQRTWSQQGGSWRWHPTGVRYEVDMCPRSLELLRRAVHIDISPELTGQQVEEIAEALHKVFQAL
jgi:8-amino-3,8-dideoxy-alpha-D-manno-octulosonate transaminase